MNRTTTLDPARVAAALAIAEQAERFPYLLAGAPGLEAGVQAQGAGKRQGGKHPARGRNRPVGTLPGAAVGADAARAKRSYLVVIRRWLSLQAVIEHASDRELSHLEPRVQALLLLGAAEMLIQDVPAYAAVDTWVAHARALVRPGAAGLTNAILRRVADLAGERLHVEGESEAEASADVDLAAGIGTKTDLTPDFFPLSEGGWRLADAVFGHENRITRLSEISGMPVSVLNRWNIAFGIDRAQALALAAMDERPIVVTGHGAEGFGEPHEQSGWAVHSGPDLPEWLAGDPTRRVQDPSAGLAIRAWADELTERGCNLAVDKLRILDACAGRGTKTRQLLEAAPQSLIDVYEPDAARRADLTGLARHDSIAGRIRLLESLDQEQSVYDLILLDVPCSNSGVFARRPEARFRFSPSGVNELVAIQRSIIDEAMAGMAPHGMLLYTTCSLEPEENHEQARYVLHAYGGRIIREEATDPCGGAATTSRDGAYHALIGRAD